MRESSASARCIAIVLCLLSALALTACARTSTRPETPPTPPLVACDLQPLSPIPAIPELVGMDSWAIEIMGLYEIAATRVIAANDCLGRLRKGGVIR